jgi:hypothetical protein
MAGLLDSNPSLFLIVGTAAIIMGIVWTVFPFVVISKLGKIEEHLRSIRSDVDTKP